MDRAEVEGQIEEGEVARLPEEQGEEDNIF